MTILWNTSTTLPPNVSDEALPSICFYGKAGAGKTTFAEAYSLHGNPPVPRVSFAASLKEIAVYLWGKDVLTNRAYLQDLGTKLREIDPNVWLNVATRSIDSYQLEGLPVTNDDCRFPNEFNALWERDFLMVKLVCDEDTRKDRLYANGKLQDERRLLDESETALDDDVRYSAHAVIDTTNFTSDNAQVHDAIGELITKLRRTS